MKPTAQLIDGFDTHLLRHGITHLGIRRCLEIAALLTEGLVVALNKAGLPFQLLSAKHGNTKTYFEHCLLKLAKRMFEINCAIITVGCVYLLVSLLHRERPRLHREAAR